MRVWMEEQQVEEQKNKPKTDKNIIIIVFCTMFLALLIMVISAYIATRTQSYVVNGLSMNPTLAEGDKLFFQWSDELTYGDVIVFDSDYGLLAKRVIGLPGDTISVSADGHAERNGRRLDEPYILVDSYMNSAAYSITVEPGHLFVLGDNRGVSMDSRDSRIGQIPEAMVFGRVSSIQRNIYSTKG